MSQIIVSTPYIKDRTKFLELISKLSVKYPTWILKDMGELKSRKGSLHFHIQSEKWSETGTVEITFDPAYPTQVELKLAQNRTGNYGEVLHNQLLKFLKS